MNLLSSMQNLTAQHFNATNVQDKHLDGMMSFKALQGVAVMLAAAN